MIYTKEMDKLLNGILEDCPFPIPRIKSVGPYKPSLSLQEIEKLYEEQQRDMEQLTKGSEDYEKANVEAILLRHRIAELKFLLIEGMNNKFKKMHGV